LYFAGPKIIGILFRFTDEKGNYRNETLLGSDDDSVDDFNSEDVHLDFP
jgi:hypothetical protein